MGAVEFVIIEANKGSRTLVTIFFTDVLLFLQFDIIMLFTH